jgi:hypothetical protein
VIARWKGIIEDIDFWGSIMPSNIIENLDIEKNSFRPSKWPRKLKSAKNSKLPKLPENSFEPVRKGGWPPISTWIRHVPYLRKTLISTGQLGSEGCISIFTDKTWKVIKGSLLIAKGEKVGTLYLCTGNTESSISLAST